MLAVTGATGQRTGSARIDGYGCRWCVGHIGENYVLNDQWTFIASKTPPQRRLTLGGAFVPRTPIGLNGVDSIFKERVVITFFTCEHRFKYQTNAGQNNTSLSGCSNRTQLISLIQYEVSMCKQKHDYPLRVETNAVVNRQQNEFWKWSDVVCKEQTHYEIAPMWLYIQLLRKE